MRTKRSPLLLVLNVMVVLVIIYWWSCLNETWVSWRWVIRLTIGCGRLACVQHNGAGLDWELERNNYSLSFLNIQMFTYEPFNKI